MEESVKFPSFPVNVLFIFLYGRIKSHCIHELHLLNTFICWWTSRGAPFLSHCNSTAVNTAEQTLCGMQQLAESSHTVVLALALSSVPADSPSSIRVLPALPLRVFFFFYDIHFSSSEETVPITLWKWKRKYLSFSGDYLSMTSSFLVGLGCFFLEKWS